MSGDIKARNVHTHLKPLAALLLSNVLMWLCRHHCSTTYPNAQPIVETEMTVPPIQ